MDIYIFKKQFKGDIMKINIEARLKNKVFLISMSVLLISIIYKVLSLFGIAPSIDENAVLEVVSMVVDFLALLGVVVDPTTKGINDSERAMTYLTENDVRDNETLDNESEGVV